MTPHFVVTTNDVCCLSMALLMGLYVVVDVIATVVATRRGGKK